MIVLRGVRTKHIDNSKNQALNTRESNSTNEEISTKKKKKNTQNKQTNETIVP